MENLSNAVCKNNNLLSKTVTAEKPTPNGHKQATTITKNPKPQMNIDNVINNANEEPKPSGYLNNLTQEISSSQERIDNINKTLIGCRKFEEMAESLQTDKVVNKTVTVIPEVLSLTKRSPRNSILPYSVFEDYLLFKCYLDKPSDNVKPAVRTRQSGHLGNESNC